MKFLTLICLIGLLGACSGAQNNDNDDPPKTMVDQTQDIDSSTDMTQADMPKDIPKDIPTMNNTEGLVINEVAASGDPSDWVELYNDSDTAIDLTTLTLSDDSAEPDKSKFPIDSIAPRTYVVIDLNDETVGFKIGKDEQLGIYDAQGKEIALVDWNDGDSPDTKSYGRMPDITGDFKTLDTPTRQLKNVDNTPSNAVCPNDKQEEQEVCDGTDLAGQTCQTQGFVSGTLACKSDCTGFDTAACVAAQANVVINEVTSSGDDDIELYNVGNVEADLTGWYVADADFDPNDVVNTEAQRLILDGKILPGAFLVIKKTDQNMRFGLGKEDTVFLFNKDDQIVDQISYPKDEAEVSYCRTPDGTGQFQTCQSLTSGTTNQ